MLEKKWAFTKAINLGQGEEHEGPALALLFLYVSLVGWLLLLTVEGIWICNT